MSFFFLRHLGVRLSVLLLFGICISPQLDAVAAPTADGLYATFAIKRGDASVGDFTCQLAYTKVPRTVANFVGLAEGTKPFIDFLSGHATRRPFYNGIAFHRVVPGFVIQAGSPKGDGSDGPGYTFPDEFDLTLRHSSAGILSMANSGLNSNGSQFFVTLESTPWLDDVHTVFGEVVEGMNIVTNVQQGDIIESLTIIRNGVDAQSFDASAHNLPVVSDANPVLKKTTSAFELSYAHPANTEFFVFHSDALSIWSRLTGKEMYGISPVASPRDVSSVTTGKSAKFFNVARIQYLDAIYTPVAITGKKLSLANDSTTGVFALDLTFTNETSGNYALTPTGQSTLGPYDISAYAWNQEAYRGQLSAAISGISFTGDPVVQVRVSFVFTSANGGRYAGNFVTLGGQNPPLAGTFVLSDP